MVESVFITGCKAGIGLEFVRQFASSDEPPKHIFASARNPNEAQDLCALADKYKNVHLVDLDVTNDRQIEEAVKLVDSILGDDGLNLLINNAGAIELAKFPHISREVMIKHFNVNAVSPVILIQSFLPLLQKAAQRRSTEEMSVSKAAIINMSSSSVNEDTDIYNANLNGTCAYDSSKVALNLLTKQLAVDLKTENILVAAICPGFVVTPVIELFQCDEDFIESWGQRRTPEEGVTLIMATMRRLTSKHAGGFFHGDGKKVEGFDARSAE